MIQRTLRGLSGLIGLLFLAMGLVFLFAPGRMVDQFSIFPNGNAGLSTLRGDMGGLFLAGAIFTLLGAIAASSRWLAAAASIVSLIAFGRIVNLLFDGYSSASAQLLGVEIVMIAVLLAAIASLRRSQIGSVAIRWWLTIPAFFFLIAGLAYWFERPIGLLITKRTVERMMSTQLIDALPPGLHAGLCGSGSPLADATRAGPCVFVIAGRRMYVVDAGEGSPRKLSLMGLPPSLIDTILLTHFHSDHIGGLGEMMLQRWAGAGHKDPVTIIGPQGVDSVVNGFNDAYALDRKYRVAHHGEAALPPSGAAGVARPFTLVDGSDASQIVLEQDGLTITAFAVHHNPVFPAAGYRFDYQGRSIVISGDTAPSPALETYAHGVDVLFHEGLQTAMVSLIGEAATRNHRATAAKIMADIPSYHTTPEDAARIADRAGVRQLIFYHTIPPLPYAYLNDAFLGDAPRIFKGPITVSKDGLLVSLPPHSVVVAMRQLL